MYTFLIHFFVSLQDGWMCRTTGRTRRERERERASERASMSMSMTVASPLWVSPMSRARAASVATMDRFVGRWGQMKVTRDARRRRRRATTPRRVRTHAASTTKSDDRVLVVGGAGRVGRLVVERLVADGRSVRVMTRDANSEPARSLLRTKGDVEVIVGDVGSEEDCRRATEGVKQCVACFGAQRIGKLSDLVSAPEETDARHPYSVNYLGVERLARCAEEAGVERFVRVTGMSVGYPAFDWIAVLLNVVLSMTIQWQLAGEMAIRKICSSSSRMKYTVVRPGSLSDDVPCAEDVANGGKRRVLLGSGDAHVHAGKISRADVADAIVESLCRSECENATLSVAGAAAPTGGVRTQLTWDPARGMHWETVEQDPAVREGTDYRNPTMWEPVAADVRELVEKPHRRYVGAFLFLLAGLGVLFANSAITLVKMALARLF